jgi:hypothetical protein
MPSQTLALAREHADSCSAAGNAIARAAPKPGRPLIREGAAALIRILNFNPEYLLDSKARGKLTDSQTGPANPSPAMRAPKESLPHGRDHELEKVVQGLASVSGPHFWLIVAPPKLGKTWFLQRLAAELQAMQPSRWLTTYVDLRSRPLDAPDEAERLIALLFSGDSLPLTDPPTAGGIAQQVLMSQHSYLCLLDSAELLNEHTASRLRSRLGQVHNLLRSADQSDIRLGVIVASRRDDGWRGVTPSPRLSLLPLTVLDLYAVQEALHVLAEDMGRTFDVATYQYHAAHVHHLTEGLPPLLVQCLEWIRTQQWIGMERLESYELFEAFARPYIDKVLLADDSLFLLTHRKSARARHVLEHAFRFLAPYRFFTQSHLRYHLDAHPVFARSVRTAGWSTEDLWRALSGTALLKQPLDEPWQEIHPAIRRLLYRYYYKTDQQRAECHRDAQKFLQVWADRQSGKEQVIGLVESLWHEATFLRLTQPAQMAEVLSESARKLSQALRPSAAYTVTELQTYAANRITKDEEFQEAVGNVAGLADGLAGIVEAPAIGVTE